LKPTTAAISALLTNLLREIDKDLTHAQQFVSSESKVTCREMYDDDESISLFALQSKCRMVMQLHQTLTPTQAINAWLTNQLNKMEKDFTRAYLSATNSK
jgi:hypothetical protein